MVAPDTRQRIGPTLRQLRQRKGWSLTDLVQRSGISVSYLSRLEKGKSVPAFTLLSRLGQELGVDVGFFVQTEQDTRVLDARLTAAFRHSSIPSAVWPELVGLSSDARQALLTCLTTGDGAGDASA
jgi:transcriptional regulator with XRE-family HTH domain